MADNAAAPLLERKKKAKDHDDDTTSYEDDLDKPKDAWEKREDLDDKIARRERRAAYNDFKKDNKKFWLWFNLLICFFSIGFLTGTYFILDYNVNDCGGLRMVLYGVIVLHFINIFMTLLNLCNCETKCCNMAMISIFLTFEILILVWMQVSYFYSQSRDCMTAAPDLYFWLCGQILVVYMGLAVIICHFFRKFCQDPEEAEREDEKYRRDTLLKQYREEKD